MNTVLYNYKSLLATVVNTLEKLLACVFLFRQEQQEGRRKGESAKK